LNIFINWKKIRYYIFIFILIFNFLLVSNLFITQSYAAVEEYEPEHGFAPNINGDIDGSENEWENATKEEFNLFSETSLDDEGIPIEMWVLQNNSDLYILVQFELEKHPSNEFIAILISEDESENEDSFYDAKILQFNNLGSSNEDIRYRDFHIRNGQFFRDEEDNGEGDAELDGNKVIYEFRIPVNESEGDDDDDVSLDFGETYAFKIIYGENSDYTNIINKKSNIVLIDIEYPPQEDLDPWAIARFVIIIIVFSVISTLYGLYVYRILIIKKKMRRIRG
jgi:hypothetical protein